MPSLAMTLPLARRSPLYIPRRDLAAAASDTLALAFTIVAEDDPDSALVDLTGATVRLEIRRDEDACRAWWDYGSSPALPGEVLYSGDATIALPLTGGALVVVAADAMADWPRRSAWTVRLIGADGVSSMVAAGIMNLSMGDPASSVAASATTPSLSVAIGDIVPLGTNQATAAPIVARVSVALTAAAGTGIILDAGAAVGDEREFINRSLVDVLVYPDVGAAIEDETLNAGVTVTPGGSLRLVRRSSVLWRAR